MFRNWMQVRVLCLLVFTAVVALTWETVVGAQRRRPQTRSSFRPGQKVEFDFLGKIREGEVVNIDTFGRAKVKFMEDGRERTWDFSPDQLWLPKKVAAAPGKPKSAMRTWTDSTGLYKIEARFAGLENGKVTLEKDDGTTKTMPLDKLSDDDQEMAKKLAAKMPPKNPFEGGEDDSPGKAAEEGPADGGGESKSLNDEDIIAPPGDWSTVKEIVIDASAAGEFVPDAAAPSELERPHTVMLDLTKAATDRDFQHEKLIGFFWDRPRQRLIAASTNSELRGGRRGPRLESCDLKTGKSLGALVLDTGLIPRDLSPDCSSVVCMLPSHEYIRSKHRGLEVWRLEKGGRLAERWDPNDSRGKEDIFKVSDAKFLSRDRLLAINSWQGKATAWDIETARAVYNLQIDSLSEPALSVNRKQMAVAYSGVLSVLDAATGRTLLVLKDPSQRFFALDSGRAHWQVRMAFRADGRQLAAIDSELLQIWDLQKQSLLREIWLPWISRNHPPELLEWVDNDHLLVNGADLVDISRRVVLWHYEVPGHDHSTDYVVNGALGFGCGQADRGRGRPTMRAGVFFLPLPHPEALQAAAGLTPEKLLVLKPGSQVALDLHVPAPNPPDAEALTANYTKQLQAHGITVAPGAPLSFQATVEAGKTESVTYQTIGRMGSETVNVTAQKCRLALVENGKVLWEHAGQVGGASMLAVRKNDETFQTAIDREHQTAPMNYFRKLSLPGTIARQGEQGAYGFSRVTPMGAVPYEPKAVTP